MATIRGGDGAFWFFIKKEGGENKECRSECRRCVKPRSAPALPAYRWPSQDCSRERFRCCRLWWRRNRGDRGMEAAAVFRYSFNPFASLASERPTQCGNLECKTRFFDERAAPQPVHQFLFR